MFFNKDYQDFLDLLNKNGVRYCIIGAYAVATYGTPRYTKDMDILIDPTVENAEKMLKVVSDFGFGSLNLKREDFIDKDSIIQLGYEPVRIDIIKSIEGLSFAEVWASKTENKYGDINAYYIGLDELIKAKEISVCDTRRTHDASDLAVLKEIKAGKKQTIKKITQKK